MPETTTQPVMSRPIGQRLVDALGKIADGITTLRVYTVIGAVDGKSAITIADGKVTMNVGEGVQEAASTITNMLDGDCSAVFTKGFIDNPAYIAMHKQSVIDALAIRANTVEMLEKGVAAIKGLLET
jgi:hypothetical protein